MLPLLEIIPLGHDIIKMLENDAPYSSLVGRTHVIGRVGVL
jgi:hypothetical protein